MRPGNASTGPDSYCNNITCEATAGSFWVVELARKGRADLEFSVSQCQEILPVVLLVGQWLQLFSF